MYQKSYSRREKTTLPSMNKKSEWCEGQAQCRVGGHTCPKSTHTISEACWRHLTNVRADCLATNTEYCDRCMHAATQATNVAQIKTEGTKGLLQG
jgi:hypothetical protein